MVAFMGRKDGRTAQEGTLCTGDKDLIMPMGVKEMFILPTPAGHVSCKTENFEGDRR